MKKIIGSLLLCASLCLAFSATALSAPSPTDPHPVKHHHHKKHVKAKPGPDERVHMAQVWLVKLSYDPGQPDGYMGPRTRAALKAFERDHEIPVTDKITDEVFDLLRKEAEAAKAAETAATPRPDFYALHPDFYGYYGPEYSDPNMLNMPQSIPTRFGDMQLAEQQPALTRDYVITLNDQPIFHTEYQPSAIDLSRTFTVGEADAIVLTTYNNGNTVCPYQHFLIVLRPSSIDVFELYNCTRTYRAYTGHDGLFVSFPGNHVDGWSSGAMWRYDNGMLMRL